MTAIQAMTTRKLGGPADNHTPLLYVNSSFFITSFGCFSYSSAWNKEKSPDVLSEKTSRLTHFLGRFPGRRSVRPGHPLGCRRRRHFDHRTANVGPAQHRRRGRCRLRREVVLALVGGATHLEDDLHVVRGAAPPYSPMQVVLRRRRWNGDVVVTTVNWHRLDLLLTYKIVIFAGQELQTARLRCERTKCDREVHQLVRFVAYGDDSRIGVRDSARFVFLLWHVVNNVLF